VFGVILLGFPLAPELLAEDGELAAIKVGLVSELEPEPFLPFLLPELPTFGERNSLPCLPGALSVLFLV
jgi:hypothetical protein